MQPRCRHHILLAEDNDFNRQLTCAVLEEHGCHVTLAEDGECALALFREHSFDLILMDVNMPKMDGHGAARSIRSIEQARGMSRTPIFALTANSDPGERQACRDSGMDYVLIKPFSISDLMEGTKRCGVRYPLGDHRAEPAAATDAQAGPRAVDATAMDRLFSERVLADFVASPERLAQYFRLLCSDIGNQLAAMNAAYGVGDHDGLRKAAHAAKGVAQGLRDQSLSILAGQIENQAQRGNLAGISEALSDFSRVYRSFSCIDESSSYSVR